jgi:hypothetical protein
LSKKKEMLQEIKNFKEGRPTYRIKKKSLHIYISNLYSLDHINRKSQNCPQQSENYFYKCALECKCPDTKLDEARDLKEKDKIIAKLRQVHWKMENGKSH